MAALAIAPEPFSHLAPATRSRLQAKEDWEKRPHWDSRHQLYMATDCIQAAIARRQPMKPATAVKMLGRPAPTMGPGTMTGLQAIFHHPNMVFSTIKNVKITKRAL
ncbi:MAG TPA: hypothetical protein VM715_09785 [Candidatus Acidoferrum sp.]|nr:hypothetical protein [Candidatus Acidoferrum sp.]